MSESDVRVIAPEVGGGFGVKIGAYPEDVIISAIARELKRPVKWIESRAENMLATNHGRDQNIKVQVAARKDGTVLGLKEKITSNIGAYPLAAGLAVLTAQMAVGTYNIPNITIDVTCVHTNTMSVAAYRGAGRPEACYYIERIMDQRRGRHRRGPGRGAPQELHRARRLPVQDADRPDLRQRRVRALAR